jgi:AraC-like DNA-binding protein
MFVEHANAMTAGATITSTVSDNWLWILRRPNNPGNIDSWYAEQFVIATFVKAISSYLRNDWRPQKLKIRQATRPDNIPYQWSEADIETANLHTAIGVKLVDIVSETTSGHEHTALPGIWGQAELKEVVVNDRACLRSAVLHYIDHEAEPITRVADAFGVSERTFRRHLKTAGLSYSELVDETRYKRSLELLNDTNLSITELALDLGYQYPENFTRAFRKRVGVSPSAYRKMMAEGMISV